MFFTARTCCSAAVSESGADARCRVTTRGMAYGPHAVARLDGKVLFVRGAAPDEDVDVVVREPHPKFAYADVVEVVRPSAQRRVPPCPYLPRCGGCSWQHLEYTAQLEAKRGIVQEQLRRIGGIDAIVAPPLPSPREFGYRQRLKLRVADGQVGFYAPASHTLVPIAHCLLALPPVDAAIEVAAALVGALAGNVRRIEIIGCGDGSPDVVLSGEVEGAWKQADDQACATWMAAQQRVRGVALQGRGWQHSWGDVRVRVEPEANLVLEVRAGTFTQVNPAANQLLVAAVTRLAEVSAGQHVLDLFAGAGNLSLPLARRGATVVAVEQHRQAAEDGAANARRLGVDGYEMRCAPAERVAADLLAAGARFDLVVLDPPRSGAAAVMQTLCALRPEHIIYVACDPATLARDLRRLSSHYRIDAVQPIDVFPHTYHIETVVRATRLAGP